VASAAGPVWPTPWGGPEPRTPKRRALSREAIVEVALGVVDTEGLDALSMRRVAQELNTGAASLYAHVSNKEQLVELVLDRAYAGLTHPVPDPGCWREQVRAFLRQSRDSLVSHNDLARAALSTNIPTQPNHMDAAETMLSLLRAGGLPDQVAAYGVDLIANYLVMSAFELSERGGPGSRPDPAHADAYLAGIQDFLGTLPADRYPVVTSMIPELTRNEGDERFDFGVDVILAGLEARARRG
jgi:AcrR family transcriptional regulator